MSKIKTIIVEDDVQIAEIQLLLCLEINLNFVFLRLM